MVCTGAYPSTLWRSAVNWSSHSTFEVFREICNESSFSKAKMYRIMFFTLILLWFQMLVWSLLFYLVGNINQDIYVILWRISSAHAWRIFFFLMWLLSLTHWDRDKMAAIIQTMFSNWLFMKMIVFRYKFCWNEYTRVQSTIVRQFTVITTNYSDVRVNAAISFNKIHLKVLRLQNVGYLVPQWF